MTYEEIVAKVKEGFGSADVSNYEGRLAIQINITGEGEGIFYAEIKDGQLFIEPYDYKGNDATFIASGDDIIAILNGTLDPIKAFEDGKLKVEGDLTKALSIKPVIENAKKPAKKTPGRKPASKTAEKAEKVAKTTRSATKSVSKTTVEKTPKASEKKADKATAIIGLAEPKKAPAKSAAPKSASKKTTKKAKESTKPAKKTTRASKKG